MNKIAINLIKKYQKHISKNTKPRCRHLPTCSNYGIGCYKNHNFFKATFLTIKRILTCNPLFKPKYDPVSPNYKNEFKFGPNLKQIHELKK